MTPLALVTDNTRAALTTDAPDLELDAPEYPIPDAALQSHLAILGKTGAGKTYAAKGAVERLIRTGKRVCIIDPTGAWWGLRHGAEGPTTAGLPVVVFGGNFADHRLDARHGAKLAQIIADGNFSAVIDVSGMDPEDMTEFFADFAETLYRVIKRPLHLVLDEAHRVAPQGGAGKNENMGRMIRATNTLVTGGRSRGLRIMLLTQRPAKLHKDSLTQVETLVAMRMVAPQDRMAVEKWVDGQGDKLMGKRLIASLPNLERGEGWVWAPELDILSKHSFPRIATFDCSRTPDLEDDDPADFGEIDMDSIAAALGPVDEAEPIPDGVSPAQLEALLMTRIQEAEARGYQRGLADGVQQGKASAREALLAALGGEEVPG